MRYRRADVAGGTNFFAVELVDRNRHLLVEHIAVVRGQTKRCQEPFDESMKLIVE